MTLFARLRESPSAATGAIILAFFGLLALLGPWLFPDPGAFVGVPHAPPSASHLLGTTGQGQDVLAQTVAGARVTLLTGLAVGLLSVALGALLGVTAGYFGGRVDDALSLVTNVALVLPGLPLAIVVAAWLPSGPVTLALVLILTGWAWHARVVRSATLALRRRDFIAAAIVGGASSGRVLLTQLLPNMGSLLASQTIGATAWALGAQVGLEFLGLGDASAVTWGTNLYWAANDAALLTGSWWTFLPTGLCLALVCVALTLLNGAIDTFTDPRLVAERHWRRTLTAAGRPPEGPDTPVWRHDP